MDGVSEGTPLLPVILVVDYMDRLFDGRSLLPLLAGIVFAYYAFAGCWLDLCLILAFVAPHHASAIVSLILDSDSIKIGGFGGIAVGFLTVSYQQAQHTLSKAGVRTLGSATPYLIPCRTSHTRFFPKKHSFSYSYLVVGIPVGFEVKANGILSADLPLELKSWFSLSLFSRCWFDVNAVDYLQRGVANSGLRGKLDSYLVSENVDPADYPHAYLVTAARFLGYHFNPVSFWFLYSADKIFSAIVLEVNNTFGERRPYLVTRDFAAETNRIQNDFTEMDRDLKSRARVKGTWKKDFHVSPFNSRKGTYSLLASDPLGAGMEGFRGIDITINLGSSKGHPKLVARLFSQGDAINPDSLSFIQKMSFIFGWFWVGFVTFPRIAKEAAALFFKRKLHVWYRPEPLKDSIGRLASSTESQLEDVFRRYLRYLVDQSPWPVVVTYTPSGLNDLSKEVFQSSPSGAAGDRAEHVEIRILTPIFYTRFIHYAHDFEAMFCELTDNCTVWVDKPEALPRIFLKRAAPPLHSSSAVDFAYFQLIKSLRCRPPTIKRPLTSADAMRSNTQAMDIRGFRISSVDAYVLGQSDAALKKSYRATVARLFIADQIALGSMELLWVMEYASKKLDGHQARMHQLRALRALCFDARRFSDSAKLTASGWAHAYEKHSTGTKEESKGAAVTNIGVFHASATLVFKTCIRPTGHRNAPKVPIWHQEYYPDATIEKPAEYAVPPGRIDNSKLLHSNLPRFYKVACGINLMNSECQPLEGRQWATGNGGITNCRMLLCRRSDSIQLNLATVPSTKYKLPETRTARSSKRRLNVIEIQTPTPELRYVCVYYPAIPPFQAASRAPAASVLFPLLNHL
ncbi:hypothetical protein G7046_g6384 [Stylonectria norvegica]|nr:hypothetical protein G7046_g6384 [Stylonectria norvegica]